jgi:hypothetical protein
MTLAEYDAQCLWNGQQRDAQSAVNHYTCQNAQQAAQQAIAPPMHVAGAEQKPRVYDSSDALLGEMLREVLNMTQAVEAVRAEIADLRAEIRDRTQARVVAFPATALRHGTPT